MVNVTILPAGNYVIGDLCYQDDWDDIISSVKSFNEASGKTEDGRDFWFASTKWGDGVYRDQYNQEYFVDAGIIGCIRVDDNYRARGNMGRNFVMEQRFECYSENGKIFINGVVIDTDPSYNNEDDDMNDYESRFELEV